MKRMCSLIISIFLSILMVSRIYASTGIDVSSYQGLINWKEVAEDNITFAFIRCKSAVTGVDTMFDYNMSNAIENKIPVGVYYYSGATTDDEIVKETTYILSVVKPYKVTLPLVLDIEGPYQATLTKERLQRNIEIFSKLVKDAGYTPMIYSNTNFYKNHLGTVSTLKWEANYGNKQPNATYWQYTSRGKIKGIEGYVDLNKSLKHTISCNIVN